MSRAILEAPRIRPLWSRIGETVREMSIRLPSLRRRTVSKCSTFSRAGCAPRSKASRSRDRARPESRSADRSFPSTYSRTAAPPRNSSSCRCHPGSCSRSRRPRLHDRRQPAGGQEFAGCLGCRSHRPSRKPSGSTARRGRAPLRAKIGIPSASPQALSLEPSIQAIGCSKAATMRAAWPSPAASDEATSHRHRGGRLVRSGPSPQRAGLARPYGRGLGTHR